MKKEISLLFQLYLGEVHYFLAVKTAVFCALPKLILRPKYLSCSYQLITLLLYSGKALKKVIAHRLSKIAIKMRLIGPKNLVAVARHLAMNAAATLTHNIDKACQNSEVLTLLVFDIKGVFDSITEKKLTAHL